jgi:hypothetical protein
MGQQANMAGLVRRRRAKINGPPGQADALFLPLLLVIAPILPPRHAGNTAGGQWTANDSLGFGCGEHRRRHCKACGSHQSQNGKHPSTRNRFQSDLFAHQTLQVEFESLTASVDERYHP